MKKIFARRRVFGALIGLTAGWYAAGMLPSQAIAAPSQVEGSWKVTLTPDEGAKGQKETKVTLVFKPAEFSVTEWAKQGYKPAEYQTDDRRFGPCKFDATLENEKTGEKAKWSGVANANTIDGDLTLTKKNGDEVKYTFKGERAGK